MDAGEGVLFASVIQRTSEEGRLIAGKLAWGVWPRGANSASVLKEDPES